MLTGTSREVGGKHFWDNFVLYLGGFPLTEKNPQTCFDPPTIQKQKFWIWDLSLIWFCVQTNKYLKENSISELHHD